jgi:hypothetical protein
VLGLWPLGLGLSGLGKLKQATEACERLVSLTRRAAAFVGQLGIAYGAAGEREKVLALRKELLERRANEYITPISLVEIDLGLGDWENAYSDLLAYADAGGSCWTLEVALGPRLDELEREPRWAELFRKLGRVPLKN